MIRSIHIKNFQAYADTVLELSPAVTVITGESDQGKTSILRALRKILRNVPTGDFFIRWNQSGNCEIEIDVDGVKIRRIVGKKNVNIYEIDGLPFKNFGISIPEEVRLALKIADIQTFEKDKIDLNIRTQHEGLFLVGGTGVESLRGRIFGKITGSDQINRAVTFLNAKLKTGKRDLDSMTVIKEGYESEIVKLDYLKQAKEWVDYIRSQIQVIEDSQKRLMELKDIDSKLTQIRQSAVLLKKNLEILATVDCKFIMDKCELYNDLQNLNDSLLEIEPGIYKFERISCIGVSFPYKSVENLVSKLSSLRSTLLSLQSVESSLEKVIPITEISTDFSMSECDTLLGQLQVFQTLKNNLDRTRDNGISEGTNFKLLKEAVVREEESLEQLKKEIGICPTCDRPFEKVHEH